MAARVVVARVATLARPLAHRHAHLALVPAHSRCRLRSFASSPVTPASGLPSVPAGTKPPPPVNAGDETAGKPEKKAKAEGKKAAAAVAGGAPAAGEAKEVKEGDDDAAAASAEASKKKEVRSVRGPLDPKPSVFIREMQPQLKKADHEDYLPPVPFPDRLDKAPHVYTARTLRALTGEDRGKYYQVPVEDRKQVPKWLHVTVDDELRTTGGYLMAREPALTLLHEMAQFSGEADKKQRDEARKKLCGQSVVVQGSRGTGKSVSLYQATQAALQQGWLVLGTTGEEFLNETLGQVRRNQLKPAIMDQVPFSAAWFDRLVETQGEVLKSITLKKKYRWRLDKNKEADEPAATNTLYDLMRYAIRVKNWADTGNVVLDIFDELHAVTEVPVLVVIDNVNFWERPSFYVEPTNHWRNVPASEMAMVNQFQAFISSPPVNGFTLWSYGSHASQKVIPRLVEKATRRLTVKPYDNEELAHAVMHYHVAGFSTREISPAPEFLGKIKMTTQGNPREVFQDACFQ